MSRTLLPTDSGRLASLIGALFLAGNLALVVAGVVTLVTPRGGPP